MRSRYNRAREELDEHETHKKLANKESRLATYVQPLPRDPRNPDPSSRPSPPFCRYEQSIFALRETIAEKGLETNVAGVSADVSDLMDELNRACVAKSSEVGSAMKSQYSGV